MQITIYRYIKFYRIFANRCKLNYIIKDQRVDDNGRYVIILTEIQGNSFLLINTYFPNYEKQQVQFMREIGETVDEIDCPVETQTIWGGDFNFIFDTELEASGGNPTLKMDSIETIKTIMPEYDLSDIWRIRNSNTKRYTWKGAGQGRKSQSNIFILRRLDFFLVSDVTTALY